MTISPDRTFRNTALRLGGAALVAIAGIVALDGCNYSSARVGIVSALTETPADNSLAVLIDLSVDTPTAAPTEDVPIVEVPTIDVPTNAPTNAAPTETLIPTLNPTVTPAVDERNMASTDKQSNFFNNTIVDMAQGQYQGYAALQVYLPGEQDISAKGIVADTGRQENWVSTGILSNTMSITDTSSVDNYYSSGDLSDIDLAPNRDASDRFQTKAFTLEAKDVLSVLEKTAEAWTDFETGNLKIENPQAYYAHLTKNLTLMLRSLGVSLIDRNNDTFEMVINGAGDVEKFVQSDFEAGIISRVTDAGVNKHLPNPKGVGTKDVYHMNRFGNPGVIVNAWKETYKFDEESQSWIFDRMIPVGNVANGGKDAKLFFFYQWEKTGDNHWLLNLVLIPDNPALNMLSGFKGWVDGLYATAPLPFGKQGSVLSTPKAVLSPTPTPTIPGVTQTPGHEVTPTPTPRDTSTPQGPFSSPPPTSTREARETALPTATNRPTEIPTMKPTNTGVPPTQRPTSTMEPRPTSTSSPDLIDSVSALIHHA